MSVYATRPTKRYQLFGAFYICKFVSHQLLSYCKSVAVDVISLRDFWRRPETPNP